MKKNIHPKIFSVQAICSSCNNVISIVTTIKKNFSIEICNKCHPFYTGKQRSIGKGSRISRFKKQFRNTIKI
ncbi:50S ribosomal protein L31 [bacterium endosymbiont of Pedicinus badii]|uniref:50S ribosomal protein L31 n=1 Tax=bacterium endosymbiont of Pedicinus badii TaxID=1719126 RepID=UPI0009B9B2AA|nr:50S ribosomal protein L31 [bacterium endosymbiont of Pedicinus badii]OQM34050.1 50S ribosomal protein L31 [bacterium endosymbiont of Pedicinus badii]